MCDAAFDTRLSVKAGNLRARFSKQAAPPPPPPLSLGTYVVDPPSRDHDGAPERITSR